jgi:hypothetical protein
VLLPALFETTFFIVVLRVVGTPLAVHLTLETVNGPGIGSQFGTGYLQSGGACLWDDGKRGRAQVQSDRILTYRVFRFL